MDKFTIYTDGSCDNIQYPNYGGWAYLILENGNIIEQRSGNDIHTTNNRMEMVAIIESLVELPKFSEVEIFTDSEYCIGVFSNKYRAKVNLDLIEQFKELVDNKQLDVSFKWVKGHSNDKYNAIVDNLANKEFEKASGNKITDFKRIKTDESYKKEVFKNSKQNMRNKLLAELIQSIINDTTPKGINYIQQKVDEINMIFKLKY